MISPIPSGYVHYKHSGSPVTDITTDRLRFKLMDNNQPPNISPTLQFEVRILQRDNEAPTAHQGMSM